MDAPLVKRARDARSFNTTPTDSMTFLCEGSDAMPDVMIEQLSPGDGPPLHSHPWQAWDVVTRGRVRYRVGDDTWDLEPGDFVYVPRDVVHAFMAIGDEPAEVVQYQWPGGFHVAYAELAAVFAKGKPDFGALQEVAQRHRITLHGPPLRAEAPPAPA
jgi:mannose-6-phosphate isomerase-like protein (cupin superfamily)